MTPEKIPLHPHDKFIKWMQETVQSVHSHKIESKIVINQNK